MAWTSESDVWDQDLLGNAQAESILVKWAPNRKQATKATVVRDDWDDDDNDDEGEQEMNVDRGKEWYGDENMKASGTAPGPRPLIREEDKAEEESGKIWEEANKRTPMPELIVAAASTSQSVPPPPAALQPALRILKRPSANNNTNHTSGAPPGPLTSSSLGPNPGLGLGSGTLFLATRGTLAEREAQYQEARSRIFGEKEKLMPTSGLANLGSGGVAIVRDPLGPASDLELEPGGQDKPHGAKGFGGRQRGKKQWTK